MTKHPAHQERPSAAQTPEATIPEAGRKPLLLIHNLFNYGHFLVYADTLTQWGLSRGFRVALLGRGLAGTRYQRRYQGEEQVQLLDLNPADHLDQRQAAASKTELRVQAWAELLQAQRELKPEATVLLSTDEFLFHAEHVLPPGFAFPAPTVGLVTFGHRDCYLGHEDLYARALNRALTDRQPFSAVLTLDEYQTAALDPREEHLVFLPDIYADPPGGADPQDTGGSLPLSAQEEADTSALRVFLDLAKGPVLPVLGKIDQRKNAVWILRAAAATPGACCVVLGERVPSTDDAETDAEIDALLAALAAQGRAFVRQGYVPEALFRQVLTHRATPFLPLPYNCHYGSSGPQLQAFAAGKPTLVPDVGLMAWRVQAHGLGASFAHGDEQDFRRVFDIMLAEGQAAYTDNLARFMRCFTPEVRNAQLDKAFGLAPQGADLLPRLTGAPLAPPEAELLRQGLGLLHAGNPEEALERFDSALALRPDDAVTLLRKALALHGLDRREEAQVALRQCLDHGGAKELGFTLRAQLDLLEAYLDELTRHGDAPLHGPKHQASVTPGSFLACLVGASSPPPRLDASVWWRLGAALARTGWHAPSALSFRRAVELAPERLDYRLNLSDVLRYAKRLDDSDAALDELAALSPEHPGLHHKRGQVLFERGRFDEAEAEFRREKPGTEFAATARAYLERLDQRHTEGEG